MINWNVILKTLPLQNQLYFNTELESSYLFGIPWQHNNASKTHINSPYNRGTHYRLFLNVVHSFDFSRPQVEWRLKHWSTARCKVIMVVITNIIVVFDAAPCNLVEAYRRFEGRCCLLYRSWTSIGWHSATSHNTSIFNQYYYSWWN
jgi:hypothetical protein